MEILQTIYGFWNLVFCEKHHWWHKAGTECVACVYERERKVA